MKRFGQKGKPSKFEHIRRSVDDYDTLNRRDKRIVKKINPQSFKHFESKNKPIELVPNFFTRILNYILQFKL